MYNGLIQVIQMIQKRKNIPAFLKFTYEMLERQDLQNIVSWAENGNGFLIKDLQKFSLEILPQYFKHKKYTSFVRQLNMYGFHKQRHQNNYHHFAHEHFRKGQIENEDNRRILAQIKRKPEKKKKAEEELKNDQNDVKFENDYSGQKEDEQRSVSLALEDEKMIEPNRQKENQQQKDQFSQSYDKMKSNNFNEAYSQEESRLDSLQITMRQNQMLRSLHLMIREQVINSKTRTLQSLTNESSEQDLQKIQYANVMRLVEGLNEGVIRCNQMLNEDKQHEEE